MLRLATRGSQLALWQARRVASLLESTHPGLEVELLTVSTTGDLRADVPVWEMRGQGVFVRELQSAVLSGKAEAAVHSAKDLQPVPGEGLRLAAVPERADPRDAIVGSSLAELARGAQVATGSQRRRAQLASLRPDLHFQSLRGNIGTRLGKIPAGGAIVVALAALQRLGLRPQAMEPLSFDVMLPQVGQGAIAVECREDDDVSLALFGGIDQPAARCEVDAERAFLARLGGGCDLPLAAHATIEADGGLVLDALLAAPDGSTVVRERAYGRQLEAPTVGKELAQRLLAACGPDLLAMLRPWAAEASDGP